jgi:hypothetical protein
VREARHYLHQQSALGEYGAEAIRDWLCAQGQLTPPSVSTIHRILQRHGLITRQRLRHPAPPAGWYLPSVATAQDELDAFDFVEGLALAGGRHFDAFTGISLWGSLAHCAILPNGATLPTSLAALAEHWCDCGRPGFGQFDNDSIFQGSHGHPRHLGRFVHGCLCLGVTPVFTPPRETGFQGKIEAFNRRWQQAVWRRFRFASYIALQRATQRFIMAYRQKHAPSADIASRRPSVPLAAARKPVSHRIIFLRRATDHSYVELLHQRIALPVAWPRRLVRCEIDVRAQRVQCYGLRRRAPHEQPLLVTSPIAVKLTPWYAPSR